MDFAIKAVEFVQQTWFLVLAMGFLSYAWVKEYLSLGLPSLPLVFVMNTATDDMEITYRGIAYNDETGLRHYAINMTRGVISIIIEDNNGQLHTIDGSPWEFSYDKKGYNINKIENI